MDDADLPGFAERLVARRTQLNLKPGALAKKAGITRTTMRTLEKGVQNPSPRTLTKLAKALETSEGYLTGKTGDPDNPRWNVMETPDYEVGLQFHHAPLSVKQRVLGLLQERKAELVLGAGLSVPISTEIPSAAEWVSRLLSLAPEDRQMIATMIARLERRGAGEHAGSEDVIAEPVRAIEIAAQRLEEQDRERARTNVQTKKPSTKKRRQK